MKKRFSPLLYSCLFAVTSILSFPKITLAQLRLGTGVQPGLEGHFLEYQQKGLPLNKLRGVSGCSVGFGAGCNKTGTILQKIVKEHSGLGYQELLVKAAGGAKNYQRFAQLYSNPSAVSLMPYSSFWRDGNKYILDNHEYAGIGTLTGATDVESSSLNEIASKFMYAPATWGNKNLTLRQGLVGLKTSYGLALIEEALKVPNINQKIAEVSLNKSEASFHQQQLQNAASALNSKSSQQLTNALFSVLSSPYTEVTAILNRPNLEIAEAISKIHGIALEGEVESIWAIKAEGKETFLTMSFNEVMAGTATSVYGIAGIGGVAFIVLLLSGGGSGSDGNSSVVAPLGNILALSDDNLIASAQFFPGDNIISAIPVIKVKTQADNIESVDTLAIPEPSGLKTFFLLSFLFFSFNRKKVII